jgi:hypothetical protein
MHPDIAELVGKIFYPTSSGGTILKSPPETHKRFSGPPPFETVSGAWLPEQRIVWCNVPWIQKVEYSEGESDGLFIAPAETKAIVRILTQFKPRKTPPANFNFCLPIGTGGQFGRSPPLATFLGGINDIFSDRRSAWLVTQC